MSSITNHKMFEVPNDWIVGKIKFFLSNEYGSVKAGPFGSQLLSSEMKSGEYKVYNQRTVINNDFEIGENYINEKKYRELNPFKVKEGDILLTTRGTIGRCSIVPYGYEEGIIHPCLIKVSLDNQKVTNEFFKYVLQETLFVQSQLKLNSNATTIDVIYSEPLKNVRIPVPSIKVQQEIVSFLDKETNRIDTLIAKKQKQIKLLQEKRQAIITQSVTKGLNENVKMKDSGVEWIGEIPEHWEAKKLRHIGNAIIGLTYSPDDVTDETEGTLVLRASNIQNGRLTLDNNVYVNKLIPDKLKTREGDILICSRNGSEKLVGKTGIVTSDEEGLTFGAFTTIFRSEINDYLFYFFNSGMMKEQSGLFNTSTVFQLTTGILKNLRVAIPLDDKERKEIVNFLNKETKKIETGIHKIRKSIELLKEYRSSLITHAVTGQIDTNQFEV